MEIAFNNGDFKKNSADRFSFINGDEAVLQHIKIRLNTSDKGFTCVKNWDRGLNADDFKSKERLFSSALKILHSIREVLLTDVKITGEKSAILYLKINDKKYNIEVNLNGYYI